MSLPLLMETSKSQLTAETPSAEKRNLSKKIPCIQRQATMRRLEGRNTVESHPCQVGDPVTGK